MPTHQRLDPTVEWSELVATEADWDAAEPTLLTAMLSQLLIVRAFEEYVLELAGEGLINGPAHSSIGQEGGAVGSVIGLTSRDTVNGSHRGHHQFLAKVLGHLHPEGIDLWQPYPDDVTAALLRTLREICGLDLGFSHGRGGSSEAVRRRRRGSRGAAMAALGQPPVQPVRGAPQGIPRTAWRLPRHDRAGRAMDCAATASRPGKVRNSHRWTGVMPFQPRL